MLNQWSQARSRLEAEVQRRKEQVNFATNFEEARGFVRQNWRSYGYKIDEDPTQADSTESDYGSEGSEDIDKVEAIPITITKKVRPARSDSGSSVSSKEDSER